MQFKFATVIAILPLFASVLAAPAPEAAPVPAPYKEEAAPGQQEYPSEPTGLVARGDMQKRGFGCPGNPYACSDHCRGLGGGRSGGYCGGPWYLAHPTCICVFN